MKKNIKIRSFDGRRAILIPTKALRRCDECGYVMVLCDYWWARQDEVHITYICVKHHTTRMKSVRYTISKFGDWLQ